MDKYKKLLIISHNCLSKSGSNGRTLANYLNGWSKDKIAQFYIHPEIPDFEICNEYYCMTDSSIAKSILKRKPAGYRVLKEENKKEGMSKSNIAKKKVRKNSFIFCLREMMWKSKLWNKKNFIKWLEMVSPEIILVQAGDASFLLDIAVSISKTYQASIVVYNTEGYYFKQKSYFNESALSKVFFYGLNSHFKKSYERLIQASKTEIYNCDLLKHDYDEVLHTKSKVIMNTSEFTEEEVFESKKDRIVYAGNLGLFRHKSLIEFANALKKVRPDMVIEVYGNIPDEQVKKEIELCDSIKLHGFIAYETLKQELRECRYLLHVESFDPFYKEDLKYAFSTKIADSLAVGACLFVYAPENMAVSRYLEDKNAAVLITNQFELEKRIKEVLCTPAISSQYAQNGRKLALQNHNITVNKEMFQKLLLE